MRRHVPLLTAILFASATALMAQQPPTTTTAPRAKPEQQPPPPKPAPQAEQHGKAAGADQEFARKVAAGGEAELALAKLALQKSSSPEVKNLASRIQTDHMKANDELKKIASKEGWDLPAEPTADQKKVEQKLEKLSGAEFDREYTALMVKNHQANIPVFEREASRGSDPALKQFASSMLPTLKEHLELAQKAQRAVST